MTRNSTCLESPVVTRTEPSLESTWTRARPLTVYDLVHSSALAEAAARVLARTARAAKPANRSNSLLGLPFEKGRAIIVVYASAVWRSEVRAMVPAIKGTRIVSKRFRNRYLPRPALLLLAAPGFGRSAWRNCSGPTVFRTSALESQPRRAVVTPYWIKERLLVVWESVEMTTLTPRSLHIRRRRSLRSRRSGFFLLILGPP